MSKTFLLVGRWLFSAPFIIAGFSHFNADTIAFAQSQGVPPWLTMASGIWACAGGLSIALGDKARVGAWMIAAFLVPTTLVLHRFWGLNDPSLTLAQFAHFMKNVSMLGGAFMIQYFGSGPLSLEGRRQKRTGRAIESIRTREPALR